MLKRTIQVSIRRGERKYVAECLDLPVVTEAETLDDLARNIREGIGLFLEGEDSAEYSLTANAVVLATVELEAASTGRDC